MQSGTDDSTARRHVPIPIRQWPENERPRERLFVAGASALTDAELVALYLGSGSPGRDAVGLGQQLLARFGSLRGLFSASHDELIQVTGIGPAKIARLHAATEIARRALGEQSREQATLDRPEIVEDYLRLMIGTRPYEVFVCLFLDTRLRMIHAEELSRGSLSRAAVYPREVVRRALQTNAAALIIAHNHPSGAAQPSAADLSMTRTLKDALCLMDVKLLDHFIVTSDTILSLARHGLL
ncbi:DNA repair protein RadC [Mycetohabitans endofungorum]|uniref:RadC family protein n=1 Tax=Mycetohabitans endofungorum TaxID=417203 RepID=UPI0030D44AA6